MSDSATHPLENILKQCAAHAPQPWYPQDDGLGIPRKELDPLLDELRLAGLVHLTDWVPGKGQGYALTPAGAKAVSSPAVLNRLRKGEVPAAPAEPADPTPERASLAYRRGVSIRQALNEPEKPRVTQALLFINIGVFLIGCAISGQRLGSPEPFLMARLGDPQAGPVVRGILLDTGAIRPDLLFPGQQWWRLLTCCFVHIGLIHLIVNMWSLWMVGPMLENLWGRWNYLTIYLLSGLCGSCAMAAFEPVMGAGASGALWGILASLAAWVYLNRKALPPALLRHWTSRLIMVFVLNVVITFQVPGISAAGHFGGGIAGLLAAFPVDYARYHRGWRRYLARAALPLIFLACLSLFFQRYAAPRYLYELGNAAFKAKQLYDAQGLRKLLSAAPAERQISPEATKEIDDMRQRFRAINRLRWVGSFGDTRLREKVEAGNQLLESWDGLLAKLSRSAQAPAEWTPADEADLMEQRRRLVENVRRWNELPDPQKEAGG